MPQLGVGILGNCVNLLGVVGGLEECVCLDVNREVFQVMQVWQLGCQRLQVQLW